MLIELSPQERADRPTLHRAGDVLTVNGVAYDFGPLPEGGRLPREAVDCPWLASDVTREGGTIRLTLILPYRAGAPEEVRFPAPLVLTTDGPITLPGQGGDE